jgi:hypothetical protein
MAAGDARFFVSDSLATGSFLDLQPTSGEETVLHNCGGSGAWELYFNTGTNSIGPLHSGAANEVVMNTQLHCSNTRYYRIKNVSGSSAHFWADGMDTA